VSRGGGEGRTGDTPEAGRGPDCPLSRREWILGSILLLGLAGLLVYLFDFYALPHNDYVQFTSQAQWLLDLRAPDYYKVLPLYPAVIALVSLLWPGPAAVIHAAQLVSALAALAGAAGLFLFARRYVPWGAPLLVLFVVINPYFLEFATQPLLEMTLLALGTVSFWLAARRHSGGYVAAGFAALTRWDAVFLAPAFAVMRFFESGRRWRYLLYGAAAMALPLAWLALSVAHSRQVNPYVEEMIDRSGSTVFWVTLRILFQMVIGHAPDGSALSGAEIPLFAGVSILFLTGLVRLWRRDRWIAALLAGYLLSYFSIHGVFGIATYRYHVPLLPLVLFVLFAAIEPKPADGPQPATGLWPGVAWFALAGGVAWAACGLPRSPHVGWLWAFAALYVAAFAVLSPAGWRWPRWVPGAIIAVVLACLWPQVAGWDRTYERQRWAFSETVAAVRWVARHVPAGERAAMAEPWLAAARVPWDDVRGRLISVIDFDWHGGPSLARQCREQKVSHVIWLSTYRDDVRSDYWHARVGACYLNELGFGSDMGPDGFRLVARLVTGGGHEARVYRLNGGPPVERNTIDLDTDWKWRPFLTSGWSDQTDGPAGDRHVWAVGRQETIRFRIAAPAAGGTLLLAGFPYQPPGAPAQVVQVAVNGRMLTRTTMADRLEEYRLEVPGDWLAAGENRFTLDFAACCSPRSAGAGEDERALAAGFKRIAFIPASVPTEPDAPNASRR